jgi:hypothetical protein
MLLNQGSQKAFNFTDSNLKRNSRALLKHNLNTEVKHLGSGVIFNLSVGQFIRLGEGGGWGVIQSF